MYQIKTDYCENKRLNYSISYIIVQFTYVKQIVMPYKRRITATTYVRPTLSPVRLI